MGDGFDAAAAHKAARAVRDHADGEHFVGTVTVGKITVVARGRTESEARTTAVTACVESRGLGTWTVPELVAVLRRAGATETQPPGRRPRRFRLPGRAGEFVLAFGDDDRIGQRGLEAVAKAIGASVGELERVRVMLEAGDRANHEVAGMGPTTITPPAGSTRLKTR